MGLSVSQCYQRPSLTWPLSLAVLFIGTHSSAMDEPRVKLNSDNYQAACGVDVSQHESLIQVVWLLDDTRRGRMVFDLAQARPLIQEIAISSEAAEPFRTIANGLDPMILLQVGKRDLDKRGGWTIFFDRMQRKPSDRFLANVTRSRAVVTSNARRATLTIGEVSAGSFNGHLQWTFYTGSPFLLQEAVLKTAQTDSAYLYDTGLVCREGLPAQMVWRDSFGPLKTARVESTEEPRHVAVRGRSIAAQFQQGSLVLFPPPHRYFYPLDFSDNLENIWMGPGYDNQQVPFGFGIRHDPQGDNRYVPWFNAPPGTAQEMGLFLLVSDATADQALGEAARLTRNDRFAPLDDHVVFSSHYHVEHTRELLDAQQKPDDTEAQTGRLPSGQPYRIPRRLQKPGFTRTLRDQGIDIVHLAEFHFGHTPRMSMPERVQHLQVLHAECERLSDENFLLLPGEEPNVHLGGHWISFFPKPVYWVLNRPAGTPFITQHPTIGRVYHVGTEADVLRLLREESGLAWTAHPRIKGSTGFPDRYRDRLFFQSDRFLGAAWKAMPADLSEPRLGSRVLDLLDDMSNWGAPKFALGEVDVFKIEPDHELYGHMNVNYLRLEKVPRFEEGWQPILNALRGGQFFVTTGEVLIPRFTVDGSQSGESTTVTADGTIDVRLDLTWTFPLAFAEIITGDGHQTKRQRVDLSTTKAFGETSLKINVDVTDQRWLRAEVWDVATNGAFTQPVWLIER